MPKEKIIPTIMMVLDFLAAIPYIGKDAGQVVYWISAGVLTLSVTWL